MRRKISTALLLIGLIALVPVMTGCASTSAPAAATPAAAPPPPPPPAAVGSWNLTVETPVGTQESVLTISGMADSLEGMIAGEQGEVALSNVMFSENALTFGLSIEAQGLNLNFEGTIDGDSLSGAFQSDFGPITVTGTRASQ